MKVLTVVGARPQFIKMAPVSRALAAVGAREVVVHTGQHYDDGMSGVFFRELGIREPDHHLQVGSGRHGKQTAAALERIEEVMLDERPDVALVYGDTNSTLAGGLAATKLHVPLAHVEAGPRTGDRHMPEEVNRLVVDHISDLLFAPTPAALGHLRREGLGDRSHFVGDVMVDALHESIDRARSSDVLGRVGAKAKGFVLATIHRADNTDDPRRLAGILDGLRDLAQPVVFPVHPRTKKAMAVAGLPVGANVRLIPPVGYLDMIALEASAAAIVTDSGGVQKEAYLAGVPCVTVQDATAWPETVESGWNRLVKPQAKAIADAVAAARPGKPGEAFGRPGASRAIARLLQERYA
ncbi:MAG TPA: UDP-N-acetylglucosamine 2-epimerase (non-hydrolyzing) [Candidatus Thermoplasmatota archaeon]|nr:UDP-N-acetylglucosamine 2-epimerase (non-hydrolyzing) [Candidatus Thermoplasmatota archaeon]